MSTAAEQVASSQTIWRNGEYLLFWGGGGLSLVGTAMSGIAFPLLVLGMTGSAARAGLVAALSTLPYPLFGLLAGALADRWNRRLMMIVCDLGRTVGLGSIVLALWADRLTFLQICIVAAMQGSLFVFYDAAWNAALPRVVSAEALPDALALDHGTVGATGIVGPSLGGILYSMSQALPFLADAISYVASLGSLLLIRTPLQVERVTEHTHLRVEIVDGLRWTWTHPAVRFLGIAAAINGMVGSGLYLTVLVVARQGGASPAAIGVMFAIAAIGGTAGSFLTRPLMSRFSLWPLMTVLLCGEIVLIPPLLLTDSPIVLGVLIGLGWLLGGPFHLVQSTERRRILPDEYQGRVNTFFGLLEQGADAIAFAVTGILLSTLGARPLIILLFASLSMLTIATATRRPGVASEEGGSGGGPA